MFTLQRAMTKQFKRWLFIFRQDMRVFDNTWLRHAVQESDELIPLFIFDTSILDKFPKKDKRVWFLLDTLQVLQKQLQSLWWDLLIAHGKTQDELPKIVKTYNIQSLYRNRSYGTNSLHRDQKTKEWAAQHDVVWNEYDDYLLVEPENVQQMKVFTPFYKRRMGKQKRISCLEIDRLSTPSLPEINWEKLKNDLPFEEQTVRAPDGRKKPLDSFDFDAYDTRRNAPWESGTSRLSPYIRFGLISMRQLFKKQIERTIHLHWAEESWIIRQQEWWHEYVTMDKKVFKDTYISELARREFWQHIAHYFPESRHTEFLEKRQNLQRSNREDRFEARKEGKTWYPIVDAAMRQLKEENRMHGRTRMIVASFLTKDLLIDRRWWEKHFSDYLIDYDENVNIWNRQRSASVWADPKPLRIFNPILQSERYDPDAKYIKQRLPELEWVHASKLHDPLKNKLSYVSPIVDHYHTSKLARLMYKHEPYELSEIR